MINRCRNDKDDKGNQASCKGSTKINNFSKDIFRNIQTISYSFVKYSINTYNHVMLYHK